jgi:hypothetical protein
LDISPHSLHFVSKIHVYCIVPINYRCAAHGLQCNYWCWWNLICPHFDERRDEYIYEIAEKSTQQLFDSNMTKNTRTRWKMQHSANQIGLNTFRTMVAKLQSQHDLNLASSRSSSWCYG